MAKTTVEERRELARDIMSGICSVEYVSEATGFAVSTISGWIRDEIKSIKDNPGDAVFLGDMYNNGYGVKKNPKTAAEFYRNAAESGIAKGMYRLGSAFYLGRGVPKDYHQALSWLEKAANENHTGAMVYLGAMNANGLGMQRNYVKSVIWFQKAADLGSPEAMVNLGTLYFQGRGVTRDMEQAKTFFLRAADKGSAEAMLNLAHMYCSSKNYKEAEEVLKKAVQLSSAEAMYRLGMMYKDGNDQMPVDDADAAKFLRKAAEHGWEEAWRPLAECYRHLADADNEDAMFELGRMHYYQKYGGTQDYPCAAKWFAQAADRGHVKAMGYMGFIYANGRGMDKDRDSSDGWYRKMFQAHENQKADIDFDDAEVMESLGDIYKSGELVKKDVTNARKCYYIAHTLGSEDAMRKLLSLADFITESDFDGIKKLGSEKLARERINAISELFQKADEAYAQKNYRKAMEYWENASELGSIAAINNMGWLYYDGLGIEQNHGKAMELFLRAADKKSSSAMNYIGDMYENGLGVEQNDDKAKQWYKKAYTTENFFALRSRKNYPFLEQFLFTQDYSEALSRCLKMGDAIAMNRAGRIYFHGLAGGMNRNEAKKCFERLAELGNSAAMFNMGDFCNHMIRDKNMAEEWYSKVKSAGFIKKTPLICAN